MSPLPDPLLSRELITIPSSGVSALPPSFLVNQLLDLMARQRKEVVPKCSSHPNQELLFCETCDTVFCNLCTSEGGHTQGRATQGDHTVIPFSIAIKRMSEILLYKANECTSKLDSANETVTREMHKLDHRGDAAYDEVKDLFDEVVQAVERRRDEVLVEVKRKKDEKRRVLEEQLKIIQAEKQEVDGEMEKMQHQIEVRNITKKISELNTKLDAVQQLAEPRENSFMEFCRREDAPYCEEIRRALRDVGTIKTSKTFPSLCRAALDTVICSLESVARVQTTDYNGEAQEHGGDPITALVTDQEGREVAVAVEDKENGSYIITFTPSLPGTYCLKVHIFDRPIRDCPLYFEVTEHNSPLLSFGCRGVTEAGFVQPCSLALGLQDQLYVVDTGNSRIKVLSPNLDFQSHIFNESLEGRSVTGICLGSSGDSLITVNWRTKTVTEMSLDGRTIGGFSHDELVEPIAVAVTADDEILIADNGVGSVLVFESSGKLKRRIGSKGKGPGQYRELGGVCVTPGGEVVVADTRILVFSSQGELLREMGGGKGGRYTGVAVEEGGRVLAARMEKARSVVQVLSLESGQLLSTIDSHGARLKRPTGLAASRAGGAAFVVDIGHDCVRKYRYK